MPIEVVTGDIFQDGADVLVNPVNCVGVMGAGIAKEFKRRWPNMYREYADVCYTEWLRYGRIHWYMGAPIIANLPTKYHWKDKSSIGHVQDGIDKLAWDLTMLRTPINSVAMPALGCGLGGLDFADVLPLIEDAFKNTGYDVRVYRPR